MIASTPDDVLETRIVVEVSLDGRIRRWWAGKAPPHDKIRGARHRRRERKSEERNAKAAAT